MQGLIFDFDGVIADSESLGNAVLARLVTELGAPTSLDDSLTHFMGRRWADIETAIGDRLGRPVPSDFAAQFRDALLPEFAANLREVPGTSGFLAAFSTWPHAIASSSPLHRLRYCLDLLGLTDHFGDRVFSAESVTHGKPHPDVFLHAAAQLGLPATDCLVIEDSVSGVRAGVDAGMTVIAFCAGQHIRPGHAERLLAEGAHHLATDWPQVTQIVNNWAAIR